MIKGATLLSPRTKIARRLEWLAHGDVAMTPDGRRTVHVSQEALAMMLGITRQTLALKYMATAGILEVPPTPVPSPDLHSPLKPHAHEHTLANRSRNSR
jgi:hypothetical protein